VALSRCLIPFGLVFHLEAARISKKSSTNAHPDTVFIAGVPVLNYHAAYGGKASLGELEETHQQDWIVMMHRGTTDAEVTALCAASNCKMAGHPGRGGIPFIDFSGTEVDLERVLKSAPGAVQFVEPDQPISMIPELEATSNAPSWGLDRVGSRGRNGNQGAGVHIYIMDTGVRTTHQDFDDRASSALDISSGSPVECNGDLACAADNQGHGTHCAGSAGGRTFGVATEANIYGIKVLGDSGGGSFAAIVGGIDWAASSGSRPAVGSMSLGGSCPAGWCGLFGSVTTAVDAAVEAGVTIVVAGGNSNSDACGFVPAFVPSAITVGSTDSTDARSSFSNYGRCTNIWAPGSAITSAGHEDDTGSKTYSGTSMACPHVAGAAAMVLERNPSFKSPQILEQLHSWAATAYITDLKEGDVNELLYVASDAPPPKGPVEAPNPEPNCPWYCGLQTCLTAACSDGCSFCQGGLASQNVSTMASLPVAITDCGGSNHVVSLIDYQPKAVNTGTTTRLSVTGSVSDDISGGTLNMKVQMTGFPWTTLGQLNGGNICNPLTLELRSLGIYGGKIEWGGIACPVRAGQVTVDLVMTLAPNIPSGLMNVRASLDATRSDGKPLLCSRAVTSGR